MRKKRPDGRVVKTVPPIQKIMPYIMKTRTDSMNMYDDVFDCEVWDSYIKEKEAEGIKMSYMHILIAGVVRMIALRPQLNRFIMNGRVYTRHKIYVSFVVHPKLCDGDTETTIKLEFEGTETIQEIAETINRRVKEETTDRQGENGTDKLAKVLTNIPGPVIRFAVNTLMWMDRHNLLPKAIIDLSPFHTSFFITNLKSLGINYIFHHTYEFGTTGLFFAIGKEQNHVDLDKEGNIINEKRMGWGLVTDERFCDGLYFALSLRQLRKFMKNPKLLEEPLPAKVEDVE
ncbi:MAG: 2-oxoglutarate dehydrogenase [Lachnospiraceae bacterium]|nr:2-oxoglutarate dehydrogenase [Lachnospiraceae bacterium]MBP3578835.1 2-oxoglutarate dehydrogenase [Lachnospiraceae bacterium]